MPSTRMNDTPIFEAAFRHRDDGRVAVVSVKTGREQVPVRALAEAAKGGTAFAYSTEGAYSEPDPARHGISVLSTEDLLSFMSDHPKLLPPRVGRWLAFGSSA
jgi:hypothetical protein